MAGGRWHLKSYTWPASLPSSSSSIIIVINDNHYYHYYYYYYYYYHCYYFKVRGSRLGKNEEFEVDWSSPATTLLSCSANWGSGGYLVVGEQGELHVIGYSLEDRKKASVFLIVNVDMYSSSDYVNEKLRLQPPPVVEKKH